MKEQGCLDLARFDAGLVADLVLAMHMKANGDSSAYLGEWASYGYADTIGPPWELWERWTGRQAESWTDWWGWVVRGMWSQKEESMAWGTYCLRGLWYWVELRGKL